MKFKTFTLLGLLALLLAFVSVPMFAQSNSFTETTLSSAVTSTATRVCLTSATGVVVPTGNLPGSFLQIEKEQMQVRDVTSTATCFNVIRQNRPVAHASGSVVYIGYANWFQRMDPPGIDGACTLGSLSVHPWINTQTGEVFKCVSSLWVSTNKIDQYQELSTAALGSVRLIRGEYKLTGASSAITSGTAVGVRGAVTVANGTSLGSGVFAYGTQGKLITGTGTLDLGSGMAYGAFGQLDVSGGTLTSGHIAAIGGDIFGLNSGTAAYADLLYVQHAGGGVANSMFKAFGKTTYVFDLASNTHVQMGTTGGATTAAGWLKVLVEGQVRYINLFSTAP